MSAPLPTEIKLRTESRILEVRFDDGSQFQLPFEYLRVFSPSAEVKGHGGGEGALVRAKQGWGFGASSRSAITPCGCISMTGTTPASIPGRYCTNWALTGPPIGRVIWSAAPSLKSLSVTMRLCN